MPKPDISSVESAWADRDVEEVERGGDKLAHEWFCDDDLVGRKARKRVADGETDVRLAGNSLNGFAGKPLGRAFGNPLHMIVPEVFAQSVLRMIDRLTTRTFLPMTKTYVPGPIRVLHEREGSYLGTGCSKDLLLGNHPEREGRGRRPALSCG